MLSEVLSFTVSTLTTMFLVVDAPAAVPLFLSMSASDSPEQQRRTASRAAIAAGVVLAAFGAQSVEAVVTGPSNGLYGRHVGYESTVPA